MGILQTIKRAVEEHASGKKEAQREWCEELREQLTPIFTEAEELDLTGSRYLPLEEADKIQTRWSEILDSVEEKGRQLRKASGYEVLQQELCELEELCYRLEELFRENNQKFARRQAMAYSAKLLPVEGHRLNFDQLCAIVKPARNQLLIAGAGTGKTSTIVGLVKYLIKFGGYAPETILLLSFTRTSAMELEHRILKECGIVPEVSTFHKLGLTIISKIEGKKPGIQKEGLLEAVVRENLNRLLLSGWYRKLLLLYQLYAKLPAKPREEFRNEKEYEEYLKRNPPVTVRGECVKSYAEVQIANFLFHYGISYQYEAAYELDTKTAEYGQYHPDFYLPDYGIYIEHFGIDRRGNVPEYFSSKNGKSPSATYREEMEWKRSLHRRCQTKLVETYYYEFSEGTLLKQLKKRLEEMDVTFVEQNEAMLFRQLMEKNRSEFSSLEKLFVTVIELMESNGYTVEKAQQLNRSRPFTERISNRFILKLAEPLQEAYHKALLSQGEVDFNEMIRRAAGYIREKKYCHNYQVVIVDEYQDISNSRFQLLQAMREQKEFRLFCAGDDWQSIYSFTGCDIGHILNFETEWGCSEIDFLKTTYRFSEEAADLSSRFILKNPDQITKELRANKHWKEPAVEFIIAKSQQEAVLKLPARLMRLPQNSRVFLLGRYVFDRDYLFQVPEFDCAYNNVTGQLEVFFETRPDLKIIFLTIHKSKGLQADFVFLLNNLKTGRGFPGSRQNPSILRLFGNGEEYPDAEERRLFYVALTRASCQTVLLLERGNESEFVLELEELRETAVPAGVCPRCKGTLILRNGPYGMFYGCSNYASGGCSYTAKAEEEGDTNDISYTRKNRNYGK